MQSIPPPTPHRHNETEKPYPPGMYARGLYDGILLLRNALARADLDQARKLIERAERRMGVNR